jgi:hypothetical protein
MSTVLEKPLEDVRATGADVNETELTVHLDDGRSARRHRWNGIRASSLRRRTNYATSA